MYSLTPPKKLHPEGTKGTEVTKQPQPEVGEAAHDADRDNTPHCFRRPEVAQSQERVQGK